MNDFYALLDQAIALLQERGRVSYRALKLNLKLDDDYLEALKDELIYARQLALDENDKVLVLADPQSAGQAINQLGKPVAKSDTLTVPAAVPVSAPARISDAGVERRQMTVMFCDLVGSTALSTRFDPEDLREIMRAYQVCCEHTVERFEGRISRFMGDGVLIHFGYPQAHEYDTEQAVRAGLAIIAGVRQLKLSPGLTLQTRVGIATGQVVVGELIGKDEAQERAVVGETPNLAARLLNLAKPDEVIIAEATQRLVSGLFEYDDLGYHQLKGFTLPVRAWRVRAERAVESRFEATRENHDLIPLAGREEEIALLRQRWQQIKQGDGAVVLLVGEPGIGKSRLVQELRDYAASDSEPHLSLRHYCAPYFQASALHPVIDHLERAAHFNRDDSPETKLDKLERLLGELTHQIPDAVPLLAALLSIPTKQRYAPLNLASQRQKEKTLGTLQTWMTELASTQPVLLIFEDLHWIDPTTQDLLGRFVECCQTYPILILLTCRPEFHPPWIESPHQTTLTLRRLKTDSSIEIVHRLTGGKKLPPEVMSQIMEKTDGVPLFIEELTKTILEAGFLQNSGDHYTLNTPLPPLAVPTTLQDSLMSRLDRLAPVREVAQTGALIGRQFSYELIAAMSPLSDLALQSALHQLTEAGLIHSRGTPPEAEYTFKHALVQDAACNSLLRSKRQTLHARLTKVLEEQFPEVLTSQPELLAHHSTEAGLLEKAIDYWQRAGDQALQHSANVEAIDHLRRGLQLVQQLPDEAERKHRELALQMSLGAALITIRGYTDPLVEKTYARAEALCEQAGETPALFWVSMGLHLYHTVRGDLPEALQLTTRLETLADRFPELLPNALIAIGSSHFLAGEFEIAQRELTRAYTLADPDDHAYLIHTGIDLRVLALAFGALALWHLGYPERARQQAQQAIELADAIKHPHTQVAAYVFAGAEMAHYCGDSATLCQLARQIVDISDSLGFAHWLLEGYIFLAWGVQFTSADSSDDSTANSPTDNTADAATDLPRLQSMIDQHGGVANTYFLSMLAQIQLGRGQADQAAKSLTQGIAHIETQGTRFWDAELYRLRGEMAIQHNQTDADKSAPEFAEHCFQQSLQLAQQQGSRTLALRAALSLGRLWHDQGKTAAAQTLVQHHYEPLTEGFSTPDLQAAQAFLSIAA
ncbi:MAG: AAA family ATPase [Gammaproteobacteria bacterium]